MSYINRDALIKKLFPLDCVDKASYSINARSVYEAIKNAPTADVAEVRHGSWVLERTPDGKPYCFHCSICDQDFSHVDIRTAYAYCPNCGAKMNAEKALAERKKG